MQIITDISISASSHINGEFTIRLEGCVRNIKIVRPIAPLTTNPGLTYTSDDVNPILYSHSPTTVSLSELVSRGYEIEIGESQVFNQSYSVPIPSPIIKQKVLPKLNETSDTM